MGIFTRVANVAYKTVAVTCAATTLYFGYYTIQGTQYIHKWRKDERARLQREVDDTYRLLMSKKRDAEGLVDASKAKVEGVVEAARK